jgi:hypothetical protein
MGAPTRSLALLAAALLLLAAAPRAVDAADKASLELPSFCDPAPFPDALMATNMSRGSQSFKIYHNLWYHNAKWYALVDDTSDSATIEEGLSVNVGVTKLPVADIKSFTANFKTCYVPGNTLMVDFPFPAFPDNLGHLAEVGGRRGGGQGRRGALGCQARPPQAPQPWAPGRAADSSAQSAGPTSRRRRRPGGSAPHAGAPAGRARLPLPPPPCPAPCLPACRRS